MPLNPPEFPDGNRKCIKMKTIWTVLHSTIFFRRNSLHLYAMFVICAFLIVIVSGCDHSKPPMPVSVTYRNSSVGVGYVVQFHNTSKKYLGVRAVFRNPTMNQSTERQFTLDPFGMQEFGWLENWEFVSGETITVIEDDYQTLYLKIP